MYGPAMGSTQGYDRDLVADQGKQRGLNRRRKRRKTQACGVGRRVERRRLVGGWWQVGKTPRGEEFCARRAGEKRVQERGSTKMKTTDGRGGRIEGGNEKIQKNG